MRLMQFSGVLTHAVEAGLVAAALVDRDGNTVGLAGAITDEEAMPLAALVMYRLKSGDLASRLFAGEILSLTLDDRDVAVGIAGRQLIVVAVLGASTLALVCELRDDVERMLPKKDVEGPPPWSGGGGGSGSGPAELPLIELGITVRRERGKA
jgi:hypothetical protein